MKRIRMVGFSALLLVLIFSSSVFHPGMISSFSSSAGNTGFEPWYYYIGGMVNSATGNLYFTARDISFKARGFDIEIVRAYNSHRNGTSTGFGFGWAFNYHLYLVENGAIVSLVEGDGSVHNFTSVGGSRYSPPAGVHSRLIKNVDGSFTLWFKDDSKYNFDSAGMLINIVDKNGNHLTLSYTGGRLTWVEDDSGLALVFNYNPQNRISSIVDPLGRQVRYEYDASGNLIKVIDAIGYFTLYFYDASHNLKIVVNRFGGLLEFSYSYNKVIEIWTGLYDYSLNLPSISFKTFTILYGVQDVVVTNARGFNTAIQMNAVGNPTIIIDPLGNYSSMSWDEDMNRVSFKDANGNTYTYEYDAYGNLQKETDPLGFSTMYEWYTIDSGSAYVSLLVNVTNRRGFTTKYNYDEKGNLVKITDATGNSSYSYFDEYGNLMKHTDFRGYDTLYSYDAHGYLVDSTDSLGNVTTYLYDVVGRFVGTTDANGHTTTNVYDDNDRLVKVIDASGNVTQYYYNEEGSLIRTIDANGHQVEYRNNVINQLDKTLDASGNATSCIYDTNGNLVCLIDAMGGMTNMTYDASNRITSVTDALGNNERYTYDAVGNMLTLTDKNSHSTNYGYDALNRLVKVIDALGYETHYEHDAEGNPIKILNANNQSTIYEYDELGRLIRIAGPGCGSVQQLFEYDANGNDISLTDANGHILKYEYDKLNRLTLIIDPTGNKTTLAYDAVGNLIKITDKNGYTTSYGHDPLNRKIQKTNALGNSEYQSYDAVGNVKAFTDARGYTTTYAYDELNRLTKITDAAGNSVLYAYDAYGNIISSTDANGNRVTYTYDALSRLITITDALNNQIKYYYDAMGNKINEIDANGYKTNYQYDALNRLIRMVVPLGNEISYTYDGVGNLLTITDANRNITRYQYDELNRMTKITSPLGFETRYSYDNEGNLVNRTDANGNVILYNYDALNRLVSTSYPDGNYTSIVYDAEENIIKVTNTGGLGDVTYKTYDELNQLVSITLDYGSFNKTISYTYDAAGNRKTMTNPDGGITIYDYDQINRLVSITDPSGDIITYQYDNAGRRVKLTYPNAVITTYAYDTANRLVNLTNAKSCGETISSYLYSYDSVGNRLSKTDADGNITTYGYDALYRLTNVVYPNGSTVQYTYDKVGNRLTQIINGDTTSYTYDADNRLLIAGTTSYSYDNNGNLISKTGASGITIYEYDYENRLTKVTLPDTSLVIYQYSPLGAGDRLSKTINNVTTYYLYDSEDILMEFNGMGELKVRYTHGPNIDEPISARRSGITYYYHFDGLGSVTSLTDIIGDLVTTYEYDVFGNTNEEIEIAENLHRFTSREYDMEVQLYYYRIRVYDPKIGRFLSKDPIILTSSYLYVGNNPTTFVDPLGLGWFSKFIKGVGKTLAEPALLAADVARLAYAKVAGTGGDDVATFEPLSMVGKSQVSRIKQRMEQGESFTSAKWKVAGQDAAIGAGRGAVGVLTAGVSEAALAGWEIGSGIREGDPERIGGGVASFATSIAGEAIKGKEVKIVRRDKLGRFAAKDTPSATKRVEVWKVPKGRYGNIEVATEILSTAGMGPLPPEFGLQQEKKLKPIITPSGGTSTSSIDLIRDVALTDLAADTSTIYATIKNQGNCKVTTSLSIHYGRIFGDPPVTLLPGASTQVTEGWSPTPGLWQITAEASPVPGETNTADNTRTIQIRIGYTGSSESNPPVLNCAIFTFGLISALVVISSKRRRSKALEWVDFAINILTGSLMVVPAPTNTGPNHNSTNTSPTYHSSSNGSNPLYSPMNRQPI